MNREREIGLAGVAFVAAAIGTAEVNAKTDVNNEAINRLNSQDNASYIVENDVSSNIIFIAQQNENADEVITPPLTFEELASLPMDEFVHNYEYDPTDQVSLIRSEGEDPNVIDTYWTISITRDGTSVNNIPVNGQIHPGEIRYPLGMGRQEPLDWGSEEDFSYQKNSGAYLSHSTETVEVDGHEIDLYQINLIMPFGESEEGRIVRFSMPAHARIAHGTGGSMTSYPVGEVFERLNGTSIGEQIIFSTSDTGYTEGEIYEALEVDNRADCLENISCATIIYLDENFTSATDLFNYSQSGELSENIITNENNEILVSPISGLIFKPASIYGT